MAEAKKTSRKSGNTQNSVWEEFINTTWPKAKAELESGIQKAKKLIAQGEKEFVTKTWPKAKKELEVGFQQTKKLLVRGEKEAAKLTDKGMKQLKIMTLSHKKDRYFQNLGRLVVNIPRQELAENADISRQLEEIKNIEAEINAVQQQLNAIK